MFVSNFNKNVMSGRHTDMNIHIGKTYNFLMVESISTKFYIYNGKSIKQTQFNCLCECGNKKMILSSNVLTGNIKSCGCKKKELVKKAIDAFYENNKQFSVEKKMFGSYKRHGKDFELSFEKFKELVESDCFYCGGQPTHKRFSKGYKFVSLLNGIDRLDSLKGYIIENCVSCCSLCNMMKNILSVDEFLSHIEKIKTYQEKIN